MEKKIIAAALVLVMMITVFVGCGQKRKTIELNGKEYIPYTDQDGNTVVDDENHLIVVVTDENGEIITFENGEEQTYFVEVYGDKLNDGKVHGQYGTFKQLKGWKSTDNGELEKEGTDGACVINVNVAGETSETEPYADFLGNVEALNEKLIEELKKQGYKAEMKKSTETITLKELNTTKYVYKVEDKDGKLVHYAESYYFTNGTTIYSISYLCRDGIGYDESFDCQSYLDTNFTFLK